MQADQLLQQLRIGAVVLGAAEGKGVTVTLQALGIDREEHEEVVRHQGGEDRTAGGFHGEGHLAVAEALAQFGDPGVQGFGRLLQLQMLGFGVVGRPQPQVVLLVGPI